MDPFRNLNTYKIDPLGEIRNAGIVTNGKVLWVKSSADSDYRTLGDTVGYSNYRDTLQGAIDAAVTDRNDYILVTATDGGTARVLGTAVDVNKNRVHILGVGAKPVPQTHAGLTFQGYAVASGNDTELMFVSGAGVEIGGIRVVGTSGTHASGTVTATFRAGTASSGTPHDLYLHDMQVENTNATAAGGTAVIFEVTGDVATGIQGLLVERCWIGNTSFAATPVVRLAGTAGPTRPVFRDTTIVTNTQANTDAFITGGTGATGYVLFKDCEFINLNQGTLNLSVYSGIASNLNPVLFKNCGAVNVTQVGSGANMFKSPVASGTSTAIRDYGIAVGTAGLIPV